MLAMSQKTTGMLHTQKKCITNRRGFALMKPLHLDRQALRRSSDSSRLGLGQRSLQSWDQCKALSWGLYPVYHKKRKIFSGTNAYCSQRSDTSSVEKFQHFMADWDEGYCPLYTSSLSVYFEENAGNIY